MWGFFQIPIGCWGYYLKLGEQNISQSSSQKKAQKEKYLKHKKASITHFPVFIIKEHFGQGLGKYVRSTYAINWFKANEFSQK